MTFRTILFWTHLIAGVAAGLVIFVMSFTGAAIALQPQILQWAERDMRVVEPPAAGTWMGAEALLAAVRAARPGEGPTGLTREHDPAQAVAVTVSGDEQPAPGRRAPQTTIYVNPYTGAVLGQVDQTSFARRFFRVNTDWHRWLALGGDQRAVGRWVTGVSNALFLVLALTGLYIWIPRLWTWPALRAVSLFRGGLTGKARDFNWHNVTGVWTAVILVVLTFTAMCISFPKTYDAIYAVTGIERPARGGGPARAGGDVRRDSAPAPMPRLDLAWAAAERQMPTWRSIALRLPDGSDGPLAFTMNDSNNLNRRARSTLTIDPATAAVVEWTPYAGMSVGERLRTWMRFGHTGELWGLPGQIVAGTASAGGCLLVWTGIALAWRRFTAWLARRARAVARHDKFTEEEPAA